MGKLILSEYYKLWKNKGLLVLGGLASLPLLFSLLVWLDLPALNVSEGAFDLISFPNLIWQFSLGTSLPIIIFAYFSSSLGREIKQGSIIYQVTRVANRKKLVLSKILFLVGLNVCYYIVFLLLGILGYLIFIAPTRFSAPTSFDSDLQQLLLVSFFGFALQIFCSLSSLLLSLKWTSMVVVSVQFIFSMLLSFLSGQPSFNAFVPGSVFYAPFTIPESQFMMIYSGQLLTLVVMILIFSAWAAQLFKKMPL